MGTTFMRLDIDIAQRWDVPSGYLDTATYGLPPVVVVDAVSEALESWRTGTSRLSDWIEYCERARAGFARLVGVSPGVVACASNTSQLVGVVASSLPPGAEVLIPQEEFTSNVFPWLVQEARGLRVKVVPAAQLVDEIGPSTTLVAFSLVQSATGHVADLAAIQGAAGKFGSQVLVDATQACGWLPIDAAEIDYLVCSAYKWLMAPRGTAFMVVRPDRLERLDATSAGWFAGQDVLDSMYGVPLRLAASARRFDLSPAWICWAGTAAALDFVNDFGVEAVNLHNLRLARSFADQLGIPDPCSAIVTVPGDVSDSLLAELGLAVGKRAGRLRFAFHSYNTQADVARAVEAVVRSSVG